MKHRLHPFLLAALPLFACQSPPADGNGPAPRDEAQRTRLPESVTALEGRWRVLGETEPTFIDFQVSSAGSAVREIMFPGSEHEMTNMYTLDGNSLVMTHYCGAGNQPHMRADAIEEGRLAFASFGVSDLATPETFYMAEMTLHFVDDDHVDEHWKGVTAGEPSEVGVFQLERVD